jgi:hypothetical protein
MKELIAKNREDGYNLNLYAKMLRKRLAFV